jgi:hypothetical protein
MDLDLARAPSGKTHTKPALSLALAGDDQKTDDAAGARGVSQRCRGNVGLKQQ